MAEPFRPSVFSENLDAMAENQESATSNNESYYLPYMDVFLIFHSRLNKVEELRNAILLLEAVFTDKENEVLDKLSDLKLRFSSMKEEINDMRVTLDEYHEALNETAILTEYAEECEERMNCVREYFPQTSSIEPGVRSNGNDEPHVNGVTPDSLANGTLQNITSMSCRTKGSNESGKLLPRIELISEKEFESVPHYMKGSLKTTSVNNFVDEFNGVIAKKYALLRLRQNSVKKSDLDMYINWKQNEDLEPRGTYFIAKNDFTTKQIKLDKTALNIITILRHLKRIKESRKAGGILHYIVTN